MAFVVEDGTGLADSNSYVDVSFADTYMLEHNYNTSWSPLTNDEKQNALIIGTQYIDINYIFPGILLNSEQSLQYPRSDAYDIYCNSITGIPKRLKEATCEATIRSLTQILTKDRQEKGDRKVEIIEGAVEIEYFENTTTDTPYVIINNMLIQTGLALRAVTGKSTNLIVKRV